MLLNFSHKQYSLKPDPDPPTKSLPPVSVEGWDFEIVVPRPKKSPTRLNYAVSGGVNRQKDNIGKNGRKVGKHVGTQQTKKPKKKIDKKSR